MERPQETYTVGNVTAKLFIDEQPESPREWDNACTLVCQHSKYDLGDEKVSKYGDSFRSFDDLAKAIEKEKGEPIVWLPLYLYDHSGITMNTTGFSCRWDTSRVGIAFITRSKGIEEWGRVWREKAKACIVCEVETYDQYLTGEVYGHVVESEDGEEDSCWGFFGREYAIEEMKSVADSMAKRIGEEKAAETQFCGAGKQGSD